MNQPKEHPVTWAFFVMQRIQTEYNELFWKIRNTSDCTFEEGVEWGITLQDLRAINEIITHVNNRY